MLVLVTLGADEVSLSEKVENWLVKELWRVKFVDTLPLGVGPGVPVPGGGEVTFV